MLQLDTTDDNAQQQLKSHITKDKDKDSRSSESKDSKKLKNKKPNFFDLFPKRKNSPTKSKKEFGGEGLADKMLRLKQEQRKEILIKTTVTGLKLKRGVKTNKKNIKKKQKKRKRKNLFVESALNFTNQHLLDFQDKFAYYRDYCQKM